MTGKQLHQAMFKARTLRIIKWWGVRIGRGIVVALTIFLGWVLAIGLWAITGI